MRFPLAFFGPKITLEQLSVFSGNLATCLSAGLDIPRSLDTCLRSSPSPILRAILSLAARQTAKGMSLFDALEPQKIRFPAFFLPVVRCGEESGHLDGTLRYYRTSIVAGDEAGKLEDAFDMICRESGELVLSLLAGFRSVLFRIVNLAVLLSIIGTFLSLASLRH
jgi:hypothetical protein